MYNMVKSFFSSVHHAYMRGMHTLLLMCTQDTLETRLQVVHALRLPAEHRCHSIASNTYGS